MLGATKVREDKLAEGRQAIEGFTSIARSRGSYDEESVLRGQLLDLKLSDAELRKLRVRLPVAESSASTYAQRFARVRALLTDLLEEG